MAEAKAPQRPRGGGPGGRNRGPRPKLENPMGTLKRLASFVLLNNLPAFIAVAVLIVVSALASVQGTLFMKTLIDDYIQPMIGVSNPDFGPLARAIARVAVFYACGAAATFAYNLIMVYVSHGTLNRLRCQMFGHMQTLPLRYFDTHSHGDVMSLYTNDVDTLRQMISQSLPQLFSSIITVVSVFCSMVYLSLPLTVLTLVMVFVILQVSKWLGMQSSRYFVAQQKNLGTLNGFVEESVNGQKVVKVFNHEAENIAAFDELNDALYQSAAKANTFANVMMPANAQLGNLTYILCAIVGGGLALGGVGGFTLGALASFLTFTKSFMMPINQMSMQMNSVIMALAGAERVFKLMDEAPEQDEGIVTLVNATEDEKGDMHEAAKRTGKWAWKFEDKASGSTYLIPQQGDIVFDNVDFGYVPDKTVLHAISMYAHKGQKLAFVGTTGAGKTTITNLINRFYDINAGTIRYDGIDIHKIKKSGLRGSLGMVLQDAHLFSGTVMENIRYGRLDATDEEVYAAAHLANADTFISKLPDGYNTVLTGDGANLSQGQRQLLTIARAAIADPPVLILDEATSSIDTHTERIVQAGMDRLMEGRTTFVIAHRLSTVRNSDCIMVLEAGRIIECGTHDELIAMKGKYYTLYTGKLAEE